MKKILLLFVFIFLFCGCGKSEISNKDIEKAENFIEGQRDKEYKLTAKADGSKFKIGVVDIDPYYPSGEMLYYIVEEMKEQGWINKDTKIPFDPLETDVKSLTEYLSKNDLGEYVEFSEEANYYLAVDGEKYCSESLEKLIDKGDVDLLICLGTIPGRFAEKVVNGRIPVMIYFSVDPVGAGLTVDSNFSSNKNVWTHISFEGYENQLKFFKKTCDFNNIGMIYYDESVAAMRAYRKVAESEDFKISEKKIERIDTSSEESKVKYYNNLENVINELTDKYKIDAFMINSDIIVDSEKVNEICNMLYSKGIYVFAQTGQEFVKNGALMTIVTMDAKQQAHFFVNTMAAIFNGAKPESLPQKYIASSFLAVNMTSAKKIGYDVSGDLADYAVKIYY